MNDNTEITYYVLAIPPESMAPIQVDSEHETLRDARKRIREYTGRSQLFLVRTLGAQPLGSASPPMFREITSRAPVAAEVLANPNESLEAQLLADVVLTCTHALTNPQRITYPTLQPQEEIAS